VTYECNKSSNLYHTSVTNHRSADGRYFDETAKGDTRSRYNIHGRNDEHNRVTLYEYSIQTYIILYQKLIKYMPI